MLYQQEFLLALVETILIEVLVILIVLRIIYRKKDIAIGKIIFAGIVASALTLPYLWFVFPALIVGRIPYIIFGEFSVFIVEALIYRQFLGIKTSQSLVVSLLANAASLVIGLLV